MLFYPRAVLPNRSLSKSIGFLLAAILFLWPTTTGGQSAGGFLDGVRAQAQPDLQQVLEAGLKARRPEEFRFIARVVRMVERKQLPRDIVESTFHWSRRQHPRPFPYFQRGLRVRAERIGVQI
jgi:hypothetical protein